ncbi:MAG: hypothetical protein KDH96_00105 [Candidatus Riesia sp.]|nr:hypothetical protein [Candidatus Riesia sp.]
MEIKTSLSRSSHNQFAQTPFDYNGSLVNVATEIRNCRADYVASCVFPYIDTPTCRFFYHNHNTTQGYEFVNDFAGQLGIVHEAENLETTLSFANVEDHGLDLRMTWCIQQAIKAGSCSGVPQNYLESSTEYLMSLVDLNREQRAVNLISDPAFYPTGHTEALAAGSEFNGGTPTDPLAKLSDIIANSNVNYNYMVTSKKIAAYLRRHPSFLGNVDARGVVTNQAVAQTLGLDGMCEGRAFGNVGGTPTALWGNYILLFSKNPDFQGGTECPAPTFGFTARNGGLFAGTIRQPQNGLRGTDYLRVGESVKEVVTNYQFGFLLTNCLA